MRKDLLNRHFFVEHCKAFFNMLIRERIITYKTYLVLVKNIESWESKLNNLEAEQKRVRDEYMKRLNDERV